MYKMKIMEKRKNRRLVFKMPVYIENSKGSFSTRDISLGGLFISVHSRSKYKKGEELTLILDVKSNRFLIPVKVIWIAKKNIHRFHYPGIGVNILKDKFKQRREFSEFIKNRVANYKDAELLKQMYMKLKIIAAKLLEIEERHQNFGHFKDAIDVSIKELDSVAHLLDKEILEVKDF